MKKGLSAKEAAEFYLYNGYRPVPVWSPLDGCQCKVETQKQNCDGRCFGKIPISETWVDTPRHSIESFTEGCNVALQMGKQLDGRWLIGLDVDGNLDVEKMLQLYPSLTCNTGRGRHIIYEVEPDCPLGSWGDIFLSRKDNEDYDSGFGGSLDLKYCRGALVSPPSIHKNGTPYEWELWKKPEMLKYEAIRDIIRSIKKNYPGIKRYSRWSFDPRHKGKTP